MKLIFTTVLVILGINLVSSDKVILPADDSCSRNPYTPSCDNIPHNYSGRIFELRSDYPKSKSIDNSNVHFSWRASEYDFHTELGARKYVQEIMRYFLQANIVGILKDKWFIQEATKPQKNTWYHAPFMHFSEKDYGREFVNGLTNERRIKLSEWKNLPPSSDKKTNWAIGLYNDVAAQTLHDTWKAKSTVQKNSSFNENSVIIKLLYTHLNNIELDFLSNAYQIKANTFKYNKDEVVKKRGLNTLNLFQFDLAVKDNRSKKSGWVFSTFVFYNPHGYELNENNFSSLFIPLGINYDDDKSLFFEDSYTKLKKYWDGGGKGRGLLTGPVDNPAQSCQHCHSNFSGSNKHDYNLQLDRGVNLYMLEDQIELAQKKNRPKKLYDLNKITRNYILTSETE